MNSITFLLVPLVLVALALPVLAAFTSRRHPLLGLPTLALSLFSILGGWHAFAESQSLPWSIGYGLAALLGAFATVRHFTATRDRSASKKLPMAP